LIITSFAIKPINIYEYYNSHHNSFTHIKLYSHEYSIYGRQRAVNQAHPSTTV